MFKIEEITIENFRSIQSAHIKTDRLNLFVGNNDAGKSNVLKALNLFFNGETDYDVPYDFDRDYSKLAKQIAKKAPEVKITLKISLPSTYTDKQVIWTKKWRKDSEGISPHTNDIKTPNKEKTTQFTKSDTFVKNISYKYIPTIKSEEYFQHLLGDLYKSLSGLTDDKLSKKIASLRDELQKQTLDITEDIQDSMGLESKLTVEFYEFFRMLQFKTSINPQSGVSLKQRGDGIRTRHIPKILKFIHDSTTKGLTKGTVQLNTVWGYEEPETAIELSACFGFANEFLEYSKNIPIFITTHSPAFYALASVRL